MPIKENFPLKPINPYAESKVKVEKILRVTFQLDNSWNIAILRYFNPIGAHGSGLIGDTPKHMPHNLVPLISQVAIGENKELNIFGNNYDTHDGTAVRDYIHVVDIAKAHLKALSVIRKKPQVLTLNLGTGIGYSVLDLVKMFEKVSNKKIPIRMCSRRAGDAAKSYTNPSLALNKIDWGAEKNLEQMCFDEWNFRI